MADISYTPGQALHKLIRQEIIINATTRNAICPVCQSTEFQFNERWNNLRCVSCNSAPRQRRVHFILNERAPNWRNLRVHEFAPFRDWLSSQSKHYSSSHYYPDLPLGSMVGKHRNEDIEKLKLDDESIDLHLVEDLLEHVFNPPQAIAELIRTLSDGGCILGTVPLEGFGGPTTQCASMGNNGEITYLKEKRFHGTPAGSHGSLVVWEYGDDFASLMYHWTGNCSVEFFKGAIPRHAVANDRRSTFLIRKNNR